MGAYAILDHPFAGGSRIETVFRVSRVSRVFRLTSSIGKVRTS